MATVQKVLVVGGGLGGQSVAIGLKKAGLDVEIVELQKEFNVYGVGIIQQANALRALDALGLADEAMRRGHPYGKVKMCRPNGHQFGETGTPPLGRFPANNGISRRILHEVLYQEALRCGVRFRMGLTVGALEEISNGIRVTFTESSEGVYDVVIAADGINSRVRNLVFGPQKPQYVGLSVWRYPFARHPDLDTGYMFFGKQCKIGLIPMTADSMYMFLVSAEGDKPAIPEAELVPRLKAYLQAFPVKMVQDLLDQITDPKLVNYRPLETLLLSPPWYKGRVVVLGDAAHATIPQLGSGAALAIEDAVVLSELLPQDQPLASILEAYMQRRLDRCRLVVESSQTLGRWELLEYQGKPLPEEANIGAVMGKTFATLAMPI